MRGVQQQQAQQRRLGRLHGTLHGSWIERIGLGHHRLQVDAGTGVPRITCAARAGGRLRPPQRLQQGALLDPGAARQQLHVAVPADRVGDGAQRGQHGGDEPLPAGHGALIMPLRGAVDEELHDGLRGLGGSPPGFGVVADDLVGIALVRQADDIHIRQPAAIGRALDLADQGGQLRGAEGGSALAGGIHVIGQGDARGVAGEQLHLSRGERRAHAADDVLEAGLVGHQGIRVALHQHGPSILADGRLGTVDEVQRAALVEEQRLGGIEVLGSAVRGLRTEDATSQAGGTPAGIPDGEDDAGTEAVVDAAAAAATTRPGQRPQGPPP